MTIDMPAVAECAATQCAYNVSKACHAKAITVGIGTEPGCATFMKAPKHTHATNKTAGIGSCKATQCKFNEDYECMADSISVGAKGTKVMCLTFAL